jgi:hypothetical protein
VTPPYFVSIQEANGSPNLVSSTLTKVLISSESTKSEIAIQVAAAGLGAVVAGPLGGAIGGLLAHVLPGSAATLVVDMAKKIWRKAAEKLIESGGDAVVDELNADSDLEAVYREALRRGLKVVHSHGAGEFEDGLLESRGSVGIA